MNEQMSDLMHLASSLVKGVCGLVHLGAEVEEVARGGLDVLWHLLCSWVWLDRDGRQIPRPAYLSTSKVQASSGSVEGFAGLG